MWTPLVQASACTLGQTSSAHVFYREAETSNPAFGWLDTVRIWIARSRQRKDLGELALLNGHLLLDIGVSQDEALREAAKPFWRR